MTERHTARRDDHPAHLVLVDQSGAKQEIAQPSAVTGMIEAELAVRRNGIHLREVKVISHNRAVARWKAGVLGWRRVV
ncbi:MAG: hypothetical protein ACM3ML_39365 [Micromonosporaceae bacterium]